MKKLNKILFVVIAGLFTAGIASASIGEYWSTVSHLIPRTDVTVDIGSATKKVREIWTNKFYGDYWISATNNSMNVQPTGDTDDFFSFKTPAHRPTIKREGGKFIYIESTNIYDAGIAIRDGDTYSGTFAFEKDTNRMSLSAKNSPLIMKLNSDYDDYLLFQTTSNVPEMTIVGAADLKINAGGANNLLLNHAGGNVAVGAASTSYILGLGTGDTFGIGTTQWNSADEIDGTKIKDADYGDVVIDAAGDWQVSEATALSANPTDCGANQFAQSIVASGNLTCSAIGDADVPNNITIDLATLASTVTNATLTTALTVDTGTVGITGNIANTSVLTLGAGASSISGANTGDQDLSGYWDADGDIAADEISESKIAFSTACGAGNHYYLNGNDLACEADDAGLTNLTDFDQTAWRLFYSNNLGDVIELSLGTNGEYLQSQGGTSSLTWSTPTNTTYTGGTGITLTGTVFSTTDSEIVHDNLSGFVANEHLDWTADLGAVNIHSGNYTDTNTTYLGGTNLTLAGTTFNVDDAFVINSGSDIIGGGSGFTHTFNASAGSDSVLTFGDGTVNLSTGALQVGGNAVLTGNQTITLSGDVTGSGATAITTTIGANKVLESHLKAVDAAADEECLTYEATTGDFEWQTCSAGAGDVTAVFDCADGDCNTMTVGTSEYLTYGTGYIDANRFAGVTTVDGTEFGYLNGVSSAIQTQFSNKQPLEATLTDIADGTIAENLVNTANPWADNEVSDTLTCSDLVSASAVVDISTETNLTAGRSLTMSADSVVADTELYTDTKCIYFEDPTSSDDFNSIWTANGFAATITKIWCESDQTVNMDLAVDDGTVADVNGTDLVCDSTPAEDESMGGDATLADGDRLDLLVTSVSGTPTWVSICWTYTKDD